MPDRIGLDDLPPAPAPRRDPEMNDSILRPRAASAPELVLYLVIIAVMGAVSIVLLWQHTCGLGAPC